MDNIDSKILQLLSQNARASASEIAGKVNLSTSAVIERIKKLENSGTILGYITVIDPSKLNKDVTAMMNVAIDHPKYNDSFVYTVSKMPQITECMYIAGDFDYLLKVITDDTKELEKVLNEIKCIEGVSKTKTSIVLSSLKHEHYIFNKKTTK